MDSLTDAIHRARADHRAYAEAFREQVMKPAAARPRPGSFLIRVAVGHRRELRRSILARFGYDPLRDRPRRRSWTIFVHERDAFLVAAQRFAAWHHTLILADYIRRTEPPGPERDQAVADGIAAVMLIT